jgi:adenosylcobinamide-GDP ribazoletransferase
MSVVAEAAAALGALTVVGGRARAAPRQVHAAALAVYPAVGLVLGAVAAATAAGVGALAPRLAAPAAVVVLEALTGARPRRALAAAPALLARGDAAARRDRLRARPGVAGALVALALLAAKTWAVAALPASARGVALVLAPMLGRWAIVVQCHGGDAAHARGLAAALIGRARFREFGAACVVAFAATLAALDAVGLAVLLVAAATTLACRVAAYRRVGGLTGRLLAATGELVETATLVLLAGLARLVR